MSGEAAAAEAGEHALGDSRSEGRCHGGVGRRTSAAQDSAARFGGLRVARGYPRFHARRLAYGTARTHVDHALNIAIASTRAPTCTPYARRVLTLLIIVVVLAAAGWAWVNRVRLLAKVLGQPESRIRAQIERRKR
jgi:hypothetical protein